MTDLSHQKVLAVGSARKALERWPVIPLVLVFAVGTAGLLVGRTMGNDAGVYEARLLLLLRFMAALKFLGALAAAGATYWRLSRPIDQRVALSYLAALVPMAAAPGLIWSLGGIALGALFFHAGLLAFLYLAWKDDGINLAHRR